MTLEEKYHKLLQFLHNLIRPLADRDDYFEAWQEDAREVLKEIGELNET